MAFRLQCFKSQLSTFHNVVFQNCNRYITVNFILVVKLYTRHGVGGLVVRMLAVGFFGRKIPHHAFLRRGSKAVCPMSQLCGMEKAPKISMDGAL
jgi:hypothetical protein